MDCTATFLSYGQTNEFSELVLDYIGQKESLVPFFEHPVSIDGIKKAIAARKKFETDRQLLSIALQKSYKDSPLTEKQKENIRLLSDENTFTICTAHQPNIFTGYLYFIYKIIHTIKLADQLRQEIPGHRFVPVFFMGSEDNDLEELSRVSIGGIDMVWDTKQTGAVGRMKVDKELIKLIYAIEGQVGIEPFGQEIVGKIRESYVEGVSITEATFRFVNSIFAEFGLLVLIPDDAALKGKMQQVFEDDLLRHIPHSLVEETSRALESDYKVQANPREINLFYLKDDIRERITGNSSHFSVNTLELSFEREQIVQELVQFPDRFSPNVVLRGLFQETILPNIAFIGGGSEVAYWLELKNLFNHYQVPFPVLILRNSFLLVTAEQQSRIEQMKFEVGDFFMSEFDLMNQFVKRESQNQLDLEIEKKELTDLYQKLKEKATDIDQSLISHISALEADASKGLINLEKKLLRAEKRKFEVQERQLTKIKSELFPSGKLQERAENFIPFYAKYGKELLHCIYQQSPTLKQEFTVITGF